MSGRRVKYSEETKIFDEVAPKIQKAKVHDGYAQKMHSMTKTRRRLAENEIRFLPDEVFSEQDAKNLVEGRYKYAIHSPEIREQIVLRLVGRPKKISNVRPNEALLNSRLDEIDDLESAYQFRDINEKQYADEAAEVMLAGGLTGGNRGIFD
jgi:hypothetical protein